MSNIWDKANEVSEESVKAGLSNDFWGQVRLDLWECALVPGVGKVPFDPNQHKRMSIAIDLFVDPLADTGLQWSLERHLVEFEPDWYRFTLPSMKDCEGGVSHISAVPGKWARVTQVETGEEYTDKSGNQRKKRAIKFLKLFENEEACRLDYLTSERSGAQAQPVEQSEDEQARETGLSFLKVIVANACNGQGDLNTIRGTIQANISLYPVVSKYFTVDSPETVELIAKALGQ